jgi:hypothetical protein
MAKNACFAERELELGRLDPILYVNYCHSEQRLATLKTNLLRPLPRGAAKEHRSC